MSSRRNDQSIVQFFLLAILAGAVYFVATRSLTSPQGGAPADTTPVGILTEPGSETTTDGADKPNVPELVVLVRDGQTSRLLARREGQPERTLFTDADEAKKIQSIVGLAGQAAYVRVGSNPIETRLATVKLDGSGRLEQLGDEPSMSLGPLIRPDGQRLAEVSFDNTESNFGFTLTVRKLDGGDRQTVDTDETGLGPLAWRPDGERLAYVHGQLSPDVRQQVRIANPGSAPQTVYTAPDQWSVTDLGWLGNQQLLLVTEPFEDGGQNQAKLIRLSLESGQTSDFSDDDGQERSLEGTSDGQVVAYLRGTVEPGTVWPEGAVVLRDRDGKEISTLGSANQILGWLE